MEFGGRLAMRKLLLLASLTQVIGSAGVMPLPEKMTPGPGALTIDSSFSVAASGFTDARLQSAIARFVSRISRQTGIPLIASKRKPTLIVECRESGPAYPSLGEDESYTLDIASDGARLAALTVTGAQRGLETFAQLIASGGPVEAVHVEDRPRFPWRGLMLDVARHWMPMAVVERNLDAMAAVKMNVFHWHLSDDQGFRVESKVFPKLPQSDFYTQAEIRQVVEYARDRGIRVIPEFDIPGHTTSWFVGYPELASAPGPYQVEKKWGIFRPTMDPTREETYQFLDKFIGEMSALFPDPYFHIGGDEVDDTQWKQSASIQQFAKEHQFADSKALHGYFNGRLQAILKKYGKTMIGWDEVLSPGLAPDTVIQSWRGQAALAEAARKGYRGILSFGYYLDHLQPASVHYKVDPLANAPDLLGPAEASRILGGEACMWSEYVSYQTVDSRLWPRAAAIAERLWSRRSVVDEEDMYARLDAVSRELDWVGVEHRSTYQRMLDRLAEGRPADGLRILADASEALGIDGRYKARAYSSEVPLNRFVDLVRPESESIRRLEQSARVVTADSKNSAKDVANLRISFSTWAENESRLSAPGELNSLSHKLTTVGLIGLQALEYLRTGTAAPAGWAARQGQILDEIEKPGAEVTLAAVRPVRLLVDAVAQKQADK